MYVPISRAIENFMRCRDFGPSIGNSIAITDHGMQILSHLLRVLGEEKPRHASLCSRSKVSPLLFYPLRFEFKAAASEATSV